MITLYILGLFLLLHGDHWINKHRSIDNQSRCCNEASDCKIVHAHHVTNPYSGYRVFETGEVVPDKEIQWSEDDNYWRCAWGGGRKCFFIPRPKAL